MKLLNMSLDIMFLTNDNLHRARKGPSILGLRYRGLSNGVENDQNTVNQLQPSDLTHNRLSISSTASNQSYDSGNVDYAAPSVKHAFNQRTPFKQNEDTNEKNNQAKITNPLFGVNAASHYAPSPVQDRVNEKLDGNGRVNSSLPNGVRKAPEGQDNEAFKSEDAIDGRKELVVTPGQIALTDGGTATYTTDNNGKINVHVTVMINAGTLADLKKQRSQIRTNGSPVENSLSSTNNHSMNSLPEVLVKHETAAKPTQTMTVPRFSGNTSEVVGDTKTHRCCVIM